MVEGGVGENKETGTRGEGVKSFVCEACHATLIRLSDALTCTLPHHCLYLGGFMKSYFGLPATLAALFFAGSLLSACDSSNSPRLAPAEPVGEQQPPPAPDVQSISGILLVPEGLVVAEAGSASLIDALVAKLEGFRDLLIAPAHADEHLPENPGLVGTQAESAEVRVFDPATGAYETLDVDLSEPFQSNPDGSYTLNAAAAQGALQAALEEKFPGRSLTSFLADDCVLCFTFAGSAEPLCAPLVRDELNVSPLSQFLANELEANGDFSGLDVDSVSALLAEVEGVSFSAKGAVSIEEVLARIEETAGPQVRESLEVAQLPPANASARDAALATYDAMTLSIEFSGEEDPVDGSDGFFGRLNVFNETLMLPVVAGAGADGLLIGDTGTASFDELELGALRDGGTDMLGYWLSVFSDEEPLLDQGEIFRGTALSNGVLSFAIPASTFTDPEEGVGDIESASILRLQPLGNGGFTLRNDFREASYELDDNNSIDLSRRTSRQTGVLFGLAFPRGDAPAGPSGRYGAIGFTVEADPDGDLSLETLRIVRSFDAGNGTLSSSGEIRSVERFGGAVATASEQAAVDEVFTVDGRSFAIADAADAEATLQGIVLDGGAAYVARGFSAMEFIGFTDDATADIEFGFRLDETTPDIAGARYRLQTVQFELGSGQPNEAPSNLESINGAVLTIPESGLVVGANLAIGSLVANVVERGNDAGAIRTSAVTESGVQLPVVSASATDSTFALAGDGDTTMPGIVSGDGNVIAVALFGQQLENGVTESALAGFLIGTRIPD